MTVSCCAALLPLRLGSCMLHKHGHAPSSAGAQLVLGPHERSLVLLQHPGLALHMHDLLSRMQGLTPGPVVHHESIKVLGAGSRTRLHGERPAAGPQVPGPNTRQQRSRPGPLLACHVLQHSRPCA